VFGHVVEPIQLIGMFEGDPVLISQFNWYVPASSPAPDPLTIP
jgi:hypothetical protein